MSRNTYSGMNAPRRSWSLVCLLVPLLLPATACEESNDLIIEVGTAVLVVADPDLVSQGIQDAESRIQVAEWSIEKIDLFLDDDPTPRDMKFDRECKFTSTAVVPTVSQSKCAAGIVLGIGDGSPIAARIQLRFTLDLRRGKPKHLLPTLDDDGDGIANAADICPFVYDPGQEDVDRDGLGDACSIGGAADTDGDGLRDGIDNCLWDTNPDQANTRGVSADGISDAIGDACIEQVAIVKDRATGQRVIEVTLDAGEIVDLADRVAFLVVDFGSRMSIDCNWSAGECLLDTTKIEACVTTGTTRCD